MCIVLQDVPPELKGKDETEGEASLKGHLKNGTDEKHGSQAYVPPDPKKDKQLDRGRRFAAWRDAGAELCAAGEWQRCPGQQQWWNAAGSRSGEEGRAGAERPELRRGLGSCRAVQS